MHTIRLSTEQFKTLLKLVYMGEWVVNAHKVDPIEEYDNLVKQLFALTKKFKISKISDEKDPQYPSGEFERGEILDYIEEYDNLKFWQDLADKLVERIFSERFTQEQQRTMDLETRIMHFTNIENEVNAHLQVHGIDQIKLKEPDF